MPGLFEQGGLLGAIAPNVTGMVNPISMMGAAMYSGNPAGVLGQVANIQQQGQQLYLNQLAQLRQAQEMRQAQQQWQAEQALAAQRLGETQRHHMAMEARPSSQLQLLKAYQEASPETQADMAKLFGQGTTINMPQAVTAGEAEEYAQAEGLITNLEGLKTDLKSEDVDLADFSGLWEEFKGQPTLTGAAARALFGDQPPAVKRALRRAKVIEAQIVKLHSQGDISDQERDALLAGIALVGSSDPASAVEDMLQQSRTMLKRRRGFRGQLGQTTPSAGAPSGQQGGFKVLSREPAQ